MTNQAAAQNIFDATSATLEQLGWSEENAHKAAEKAMRVAFPAFTASRGEGQVYLNPNYPKAAV